MARGPPQISLALKHGQVGMDGGGGREADRLADLAHRWRVAAIPDGIGDAVQNLLALGAEYLGHRVTSPSCVAATGEHLFART
jgi:hypothetical protein